MMTKREKLYFLIDHIEEARAITPSGQPILIDPTNDLNRKISDIELKQLFTKLEKDERVLKVIKVPNRVKQDDAVERLDPYGYPDDGCWHIWLLPAFDGYYLKIQQEPEYQKFTGRKPTQKPQSEILRFVINLSYNNLQRFLKVIRNLKELREMTRSDEPVYFEPVSYLGSDNNYDERTIIGKLEELDVLYSERDDITGNLLCDTTVEKLEIIEKALKSKLDSNRTTAQNQVEFKTMQTIPKKAKFTMPKITYNSQRGILSIDGKTVKLNKDSFRAKLLELLLKDEKSRKKQHSWDEIIEKIESITDPDLLKENKNKFYSACDGLSKFIAQKIGVNDVLFYTKSTVQLNPKYL